MNWLAMLSDADKKTAVAELARLLKEDGQLASEFEAGVGRVLVRFGFNQPHSATSVSHNIMAGRTEADKHANRLLALSALIAEAKSATKQMSVDPRNPYRLKLEIAIAAVEQEFKP